MKILKWVLIGCLFFIGVCIVFFLGGDSEEEKTIDVPHEEVKEKEKKQESEKVPPPTPTPPGQNG